MNKNLPETKVSHGNPSASLKCLGPYFDRYLGCDSDSGAVESDLGWVGWEEH